MSKDTRAARAAARVIKGDASIVTPNGRATRRAASKVIKGTKPGANDTQRAQARGARRELGI